MPVPKRGEWTKRLAQQGNGSSKPAPPAPRPREQMQLQSSSGGVEGIREFTDVLRNVSQETTTLLRQEIQLAKAELTEKGKKAGIGAGLFGGAAVMGLLTAGAFTSLLILVLAIWLPAWTAALIVTALFGLIAGVLALTGKQKVQEATPLVPTQAIEAAKSAKDQVASAWQRGSSKW